VKNRIRWALVVFYVLVIYSTLGVARKWCQSLQQLNILGFIVGCSVVAGAVAVIGWKWQGASAIRRILRIMIALAFLGIAVSLRLPEERVHLVEYGLLGWMLAWALAGGGGWPRTLAGVALVWGIGWGDEIIQGILPNRVYDVRDILLNGFSGMAGLIVFETGRAKGSMIRSE
jgi:VanZ family protein